MPIQEISPKNVKFDEKLIKGSLNSTFWNPDGTLKEDTRKQLLKIAKAFYSYLKVDIKIKDIYFTGSMANYNWTKHSDIDIHLVLNYGDIDKDINFVEEYLMAKKVLWSLKHDIKVHGFDVELFTQDVKRKPRAGSGIYSLVKDKWVQEPKKEKIELDKDLIKKKAADLMTKIDSLEKMKDEDKKLKKAESLKDKIAKFRDLGLEKEGEYSVENLVFKILRNLGYLDKIKNIKDQAIDKELSLDEMDSNEKEETKENHKYDYGCLMLYFDLPGWQNILDKIDSADVYNDEPGIGLESEPHVTILYGFHDDEVDLNALKKTVSEVTDKPITVSLKKISFFDNPKYDVLKFDVEGDTLHQLNKAVVKFPHTTSFPDYHPHMTIAYLKKGTGKKYAEELNEEIKLTGNKMVYSHPSGDKDSWKLGNKHFLAIQKGVEFEKETIDIIKKFINYVVSELKIQETVKIYLRNGRDEYIQTTASYLPYHNENHIKAGGRALVDILRSIAHELTHEMQREKGVLNSDSGKDGSSEENEANATAGVMIRKFGKIHPEIYDL